MSLAQEVKEKLDVVTVLSSYLKLNKAGANYKALCPFHKEKSPSFVISPERQIWHCFGCGKGGDIIKFVSEFENIEFIDALKMLAERAGIDMKSASGKFAATDEYAPLYDVTRAAMEFYAGQLNADMAARRYLADRGIKSEIVEEFHVGYAPDEFDALVKEIPKLGLRIADAERAGLIAKSPKGMYYDRFRGRVMFPIFSHIGKPIGFSGRILPEIEKLHQSQGREEGKYINSPETPIFHKSSILYGFHATKNGIRKANVAFLVEGQMDFLMSYQDGIEYVTATSGTAMTAEHMKILRRYSENIIFGFDSDNAGEAAIEKSIDMANAEDFNVRVVHFGASKDAGDFVQKNPGALKDKLAAAESAMQFYFRKYLKKGDGASDRKKAVRGILSKIALLGSPIEAGQWIQALAVESGIPESFLIAELEGVKAALSGSPTRTAYKAPGAQPVREDVQEPKRRIEHIAEHLLGMAIQRKEFLPKIKSHVEYLPEKHKTVYYFHTGEITSPSPEISRAIDYFALRESIGDSKDPAEIISEIDSLMHQLKTEWLRERMVALSSIVRAAESRDETAAIEEALSEMSRITDELTEAVHIYDGAQEIKQDYPSR